MSGLKQCVAAGGTGQWDSPPAGRCRPLAPDGGMLSVAIHSPVGCRPGEDVGDRLYDRIMSRPHRVLLVDDDDMVRTGLRAILKAAGDIDVVGEAADGDE